MRPLPALALVLALFGCQDRSAVPAAHDAPSSSPESAPDVLALRVPRGGGLVRAHLWPGLDTLRFESNGPAPAIREFLAFDDDQGTVAFRDARGGVGLIDLRLGVISRAIRGSARWVTAERGVAYGIDADGSLRQVSATGTWRFAPPRPASRVLPLPDGAVLIVAERGRAGADGATVWRLRPPDTELSDPIELPAANWDVHAIAGDRIYVATAAGLVAFRGRDLERLPDVALPGRPRAAAATPSGDRVLVAIDDQAALQVVDRAGVTRTPISLPGSARALRMDPYGRYVLARGRSDEVWVIAVGAGRAVGTVSTAWRDDLPLVAPEGTILLAQGEDVAVVDGETRRTRRRIVGGARDSWQLLVWNGLRPSVRDAAAPRVAQDSTTVMDTLGVDSLTTDSLTVPDSASPAPDSTRPSAVDATAGEPVGSGFTVSFAALLSESAARDLAGRIRGGGQGARVVATARGTTMVYRVVIGPFATREAAERAGREAGQSYWVYEGAP